MSYSASSEPAASSCARGWRLSVGFVCALLTGAALAEPAAGQAVQAVQHRGVHVDEIAIHSAVPVSGGEARIVEPLAFGRTERPPSRIVLEVSPGPLQRALARAHESETAFALSGRMPAPTEAGEQTYLRIELENVQVVSYSMAGSARVVLASASDDAVEGRRTYEPIVFRKRIDKSEPGIGDLRRAQAREAVQAESREGIALEIDGVTVARFAEVSGLNTAPGKKWANITLKRGSTEGPGLRRWYEAGRRQGSGARRSGSIIQYDAEGRTVRRWHFTNAWPKKYETGSPRAGAGEALASVTLEVESIRRGAP